MKLCVTLDADRGFDSPISAHFGLTPYYMILDTHTGQYRIVGNRDPHFFGGDCQPMANLQNEQIDAVITGGVGLRALARLQAAGIAVYVSESASLTESIAALMERRLRLATTETACPSGDGKAPDPNSPFAKRSCCHSC
jgi:predicted Fe-Mo cluster-binding NifX family protein